MVTTLDEWLVKHLYSGILAMMIATGGVYYTTTTGGGGPPPTGTANMWIQSGGGTCSRSATPRTLANSGTSPDSICGTFDAANDVCQGGDAVLIMGGSYGNQAITGTGGRTSARCTMTVADSQNVVVSYLNLGEYNGGVKQGPDWLTIQGNETSFAGCRDKAEGTCSFTGDVYDATHTNQITIKNVEFDADFVVDQCFHSEDADNFILMNARMHECYAANNTGAMFYTNGTNQTFENVIMYDALNRPPNDSTHTECMYATSVTNLTLKRVWMYSCSTEDILVTGSNTAPNYVIENSIFQIPQGPNNNAFKFRTGGSPSPVPTNLLMRNNIFGAVTGPDSLATASGTVVNNFFKQGGIFSGGSITQSNNDTSEPDSSFVNAQWTPGGDTTQGPKGDYTPTATSGLINAGTNSNCPADDYFGNPRPVGGTCDIGPIEFQ